ncbi:hypothetical protein A0J61_08035 [Choanephora cucurbitarum]|uniref:Uncharacterized protein n=1 Tax=Choanephora cucurbitarum TaxID=101091 RepID=A0A1C7N446_9FUNG|nr:hypothetical protein A0J61_08035 [Choanephora cucurbitarum]
MGTSSLGFINDCPFVYTLKTSISSPTIAYAQLVPSCTLTAYKVILFVQLLGFNDTVLGNWCQIKPFYRYFASRIITELTLSYSLVLDKDINENAIAALSDRSQPQVFENHERRNHMLQTDFASTFLSIDFSEEAFG